jgi:hypothetical protein
VRSAEASIRIAGTWDQPFDLQNTSDPVSPLIYPCMSTVVRGTGDPEHDAGFRKVRLHSSVKCHYLEESRSRRPRGVARGYHVMFPVAGSQDGQFICQSNLKLGCSFLICCNLIDVQRAVLPQEEHRSGAHASSPRLLGKLKAIGLSKV